MLRWIKSESNLQLRNQLLQDSPPPVPPLPFAQGQSSRSPRGGPLPGYRARALAHAQSNADIGRGFRGELGVAVSSADQLIMANGPFPVQARMDDFYHPDQGSDYPLARAGPAEGFVDDDDESVAYRQTRPSPIDRLPPPTPRGPPSFGQRGIAQGHPVPSQNPAGDFPRSRTGAVHPLEMDPPMVPSFSSMPSTQLRQTTGMRPPVANTPATMDPEEISRKVQQMIEATEKLKGKAPNPRSGPGIPTSSTTSKLFSKPKGMLKRASSILNERFLSKSYTKEALPNVVSISGPIHLMEEEESSIAPIEMRLNEGTNLGNPKVQKMVGGTRIKRKPVPGGGKSLRQPMSTAVEIYEDESSEEFITHEEMRPKSSGQQSRADDPFSASPSFQQHPTNFEDRLRARPGGSTMLEPLHSEDPFYTEGVLASDYDTPLDLTPGGASTPRFRRVRPSRGENESPTRAPRHSRQDWM